MFTSHSVIHPDFVVSENTHTFSWLISWLKTPGFFPCIKNTPLKTNIALEIQVFNRKYFFKWWIFHWYVSFLGSRMKNPHGKSNRWVTGAHHSATSLLVAHFDGRLTTPRGGPFFVSARGKKSCLTRFEVILPWKFLYCTNACIYYVWLKQTNFSNPLLTLDLPSKWKIIMVSGDWRYMIFGMVKKGVSIKGYIPSSSL